MFLFWKIIFILLFSAYNIMSTSRFEGFGNVYNFIVLCWLLLCELRENRIFAEKNVCSYYYSTALVYITIVCKQNNFVWLFVLYTTMHIIQWIIFLSIAFLVCCLPLSLLPCPVSNLDVLWSRDIGEI